MDMLNLAALRQAVVQTDPFPYLIVDRLLHEEAVPAIMEGFPTIDQGGSFPLSSLCYGESFGRLCQQLQGPLMREVMAEKFQLDLNGRPTTLTVRGACRGKDGKIHTDSASKLITVLIYLNDSWPHTGGRLRLLRDGHDLDNLVAEVTPGMGTLVAFRNGPQAWHGHTPHEGVRRALQLNWVSDEKAARRSEKRHGLSALWKRISRRWRHSPASNRAA